MGSRVGAQRPAQRPDVELQSTFERSIALGERRLARRFPQLAATGAVGGIDVGVGVFALLLVLEATGERLLGALAFGIGFLALTLARSELFTENFLVPIATLAAGRARWLQLVRLWGVTMVFNLVGGWVLVRVVTFAMPRFREVALEAGGHYVEAGIAAESFATAVLGGAVITLMTWMERGSESVGAKIVASWAAAFLLAAGELNHAVVASLEIFAALQFGAPFGYADWVPVLLWASLGNLVGGLAFVTLLRLVQVGGEEIEEERRRTARGEELPTEREPRTEPATLD